ncbi:MAG: hypothetical protein N2449_10280 [Bacteroidales bacterium]|nr:hypothetical protein [Bacteroidales bacterium]
MNTEALIFMLVSEGIIAVITIYFFIKVLRSKQKFNNDTMSENDGTVS